VPFPPARFPGQGVGVPGLAGSAPSRVRYIVVWLVLIAAWAWSGPAQAWTAGGHMQIALAAYALLPAELQQQLVDLLREHPRFSEDFLPQLPPDVKTDDALHAWIFAQAATWPDLARGQPEYEHKTWHYVNLPLQVHHQQVVGCAAARAAFVTSRAASAERQLATSPETILDGLGWAQRTLADASQPGAQRALALSWLLHLVGDAHQPLHGVALFSDRLYAAGDRGGNDILLTGRGSLHQVWDGLLGQETDYRQLGRAAQHLVSDPQLRRAALPASRELDANAWIDEGCGIARQFVYVPALLSSLQKREREPLAGKLELALGPAYIERARAVAEQRAAIASARLAALLLALPPQHRPGRATANRNGDTF
jgi:S1/P1 nuclease